MQGGQKPRQGGELAKEPVASAQEDRVVDDRAQHVAVEVFHHQQAAQTGIEAQGPHHIVRCVGKPDGAQKNKVVEFGLACFQGLAGGVVVRGVELAYEPGAAVFFLVQIHVAGAGGLKDPEFRVARRPPHLRQNLVLQIPVQRVGMGQMAKVGEVHEEPPSEPGGAFAEGRSSRIKQLPRATSANSKRWAATPRSAGARSSMAARAAWLGCDAVSNCAERSNILVSFVKADATALLRIPPPCGERGRTRRVQTNWEEATVQLNFIKFLVEQTAVVLCSRVLSPERGCPARLL